MAVEFDPCRNIPPPEGGELAAEEKARQNIQEYYKDAEIGSTRHKALADLADLEAERFFAKLFPDKKKGEFSSTEVKVCLIEETMRQRINELPGYASELKQAVNLRYELSNAIYLTGDVRTKDTAKRERDLRMSNGKFPREIDFLQQIKQQAIAKKNPQPSIPPA